jgi:Tfp pilus assembly protein PilF
LITGLSACTEAGGLGSGDSVWTGAGQERAFASGRAAVASARRAAGNSRTTLGMAEAALGRGDLTKAAKLFEMADQGGSRPDARSLQGRGLIALRQGEPERALGLLRRALERDDGLWRSMIGMARAYLTLGDPAGAMQAMMRVEQTDSLNASALNDIGMVYLTDNVPDRALTYFERAILLEPGHGAARSNIRIARAMLGDYDAAVSGVSPEDAADALNNAGYAALLNGAYEQADHLLRRALEVSPVYHAAARANLELLNQATAGAVARGPASRSAGRRTAENRVRENRSARNYRDLSPMALPANARQRELTALATEAVAAVQNRSAAVAASIAQTAGEPALSPKTAYRWANEPAQPVHAQAKAAPRNPVAEVRPAAAPPVETKATTPGGYRWVSYDAQAAGKKADKLDVATLD